MNTRYTALVGVVVALGGVGCLSPTDPLSALLLDNALHTRDEALEDFSVHRFSTPESGCTALHGLEAFLDGERLPTDAGGEVCTTSRSSYFGPLAPETTTCACAQPFLTFDPGLKPLDEGPVVNTIELRLDGDIATIELRDLTRRRHTVPAIDTGADGRIHMRPGETLTFAADDGADGELWLMSDVWLTETADGTGFTVQADTPPSTFRVSTVFTSRFPVLRCEGLQGCEELWTRQYVDDYVIEVD
jgi:hypothetical protein